MGITSKTKGRVVGGNLQATGVAGAPAGTNVAARESGGDPVHKTTLNLAATPITLTDETGVILHGGLKVYDFPEGNILILGVVADLAVTVAGNLDADAAGDFGMGTVTASNNANLTSTEVNIIPSTATLMSGSTGDTNGKNIAAIAPLDGTSTAVDLYLNYIWDDADHNGGSQTVTGTITVAWINLGDY